MTLRFLAPSLLVLSLLHVAGLACAQDSCKASAIGIPLARANNSAGAFLGSSPGQTFLAPDTLIRSMRVWRVASQDTHFVGIRPHFFEADSTGYPLMDRKVAEGPTLIIPYGDGENPIEFHWQYDPPLALPRKGRFAVFFSQDPCGVYWDILGTDIAQDYPDGHLWVTGRHLGCQLVFNPFAHSVSDLVFNIEFCHSSTTPIKRQSWGTVKATYR